MQLKASHLVFVALMGFSFTAQAVDLDWVDKDTTVVVDRTVQVSKPNTKWDTQTKHYKDDAPVKWVRHVRGANPQIFLRYKNNVTGQTAHVYAGQVKKELAARGIQVNKTENKVVNGRHVAILRGTKGSEEYVVGVWRHRDLGFQLEGVAETDKFSSFEGDFQRAIHSVKIVKEKGL